jgi:hypothetical protein
MFPRYNRLVDTDLQNRSSHFVVEAARKQIIASNAFQLRHWSEPLRVDNELSNINSWREVHEKDEAALRPSIQDISSS